MESRFVTSSLPEGPSDSEHALEPSSLDTRPDSKDERNGRDPAASDVPATPRAAAAIVLRPEHREVTVDGKVIPLGKTEFDILLLLAGRAGEALTRRQILDGIHVGRFAISDRSVDVQITQLRRKLGEEAPLIETVRGVGYRFIGGRIAGS